MTKSHTAAIAPPRQGSAAQLALVFCDAGIRPAMLALHAYRREIDSVVLRPAEPRVARAKLAWWGEELDRLRHGVPRHPITTTLEPRLTGDEISKLAEYLLASTQWQQPDSRSNRDLGPFCDSTGGALAEVASVAAGQERGTSTDDLRMAARMLGSGIRSTALVRMAMISPRLRRQLDADDGHLTPLMELAAQALRSGLDVMPDSEKIRQRGLLVMAALHARLLTRLKRAPVDTYAELGPLLKLWTAWRTARSLEYTG